MTDVTWIAAFLAGAISFLSPCVLPLVPPYLVYLAGASLARQTEPTVQAATARAAMIPALLFVAGFSTVFVALGAGASAIGSLVRGYSYFLSIAAGVAIILMGLHFLGLTPIALLSREKRFEMQRPASFGGAYVMGLAFAFGWTPCIGPILAAILAVAGSETTVTRGASLLAVYSLGLGVPFVLAALAIGPFAAMLTRHKRHLPKVEKAMGGLLVLTGIAFLSGWITTASFWILETFPALGRIG